MEVIARALVDHPDDVKVETVDGPQATVVELRVHPSRIWAKVIGRQGRTAKAMRTLLGASGMKLHKRFTLEKFWKSKPWPNECFPRARVCDCGAHPARCVWK